MMFSYYIFVLYTFIFKPLSSIFTAKVEYFKLNSGFNQCRKSYLQHFVYIHLLALGYTINVGQLGSKEIDFVCNEKGETFYVQVAYLIPDKKTWDREFGNFLSIQDNYTKILVSMDKMAGKGEKGVKHMHILKFLSEIA
jgi:predicted AAA+ superfamily ATPase